jgi:hypothetical protein
MSLPTLTEIVDEIIRSKRLLAKVIKHNLSLGRLQIQDIAISCQYCGVPSSSLVWYRFDTLMGELNIHICQLCTRRFRSQAKAEQALTEFIGAKERQEMGA